MTIPSIPHSIRRSAFHPMYTVTRKPMASMSGGWGDSALMRKNLLIYYLRMRPSESFR